ncbi:MAG: ribonuclease H-like domain-containing protein [Patescibacteria group bacterium]
MGEVVLDLETKNTFDDIGEYNPRRLDISLVGIYDYQTRQFSSFLENELSKLWPILEHADRIIGFNLTGFDYEVLNHYYVGDAQKFPTLDILDVIKQTLGFRLKLDTVAKATLNEGKSGHGLMAIDYWRKGELDKLRKYCLDDVRITRDVYEFGKKQNYIQYFDRAGKTKMNIPVDFSLKKNAAREPINLSLAF